MNASKDTSPDCRNCKHFRPFMWLWIIPDRELSHAYCLHPNVPNYFRNFPSNVRRCASLCGPTGDWYER